MSIQTFFDISELSFLKYINTLLNFRVESVLWNCYH